MTSPSRRERPAKAALSLEAIVDASLAILQERGEAALTMRAVAGVLDTGPASLYVYVANREDLQRRIVDRVIGEIPLPGDGPWRDELLGLMRRSVDAFVSHPGVARFMLGRIPYGPNALRLIDAMLALLRRGGIPDDVAGLGVDLLGLYINTQAVEAEIWISDDIESDEGELANVLSALSAPNEATLPTLATMWPSLVAGDGDERFVFGARVIIDGLAAQTTTPIGEPIGEPGPSEPA